MTDSGISENVRAVEPPPLPINHGKPLAPISTAERIISLDVLRGFALLGILISNMLYFSQPVEEAEFRDGLWFSPVDRLADWFIIILVEGKFYPLFSFLFGLGFSVQMDRALSRGLDFKATFHRRLFILMAFGVAHHILLWEGDVLLPYALCGFGLLIFRNRKPLTIAIWATILILLPAFILLGGGLLLIIFSGIPEFAEVLQEAVSEDSELMSELIRVYVMGSYTEVISYRLGEMLLIILVTMIFAPAFLGLFLIGLLAGRKKILMEVVAHRRFLKTILLVCGTAGLAGNSLGAWVMMSGSTQKDFGLMLMGNGIISIFGLVLTSAYIAGIALIIYQKPRFTLFPPIASVGQMALSNYLAQSAIATTIFYGYGFGLGGNVGRLGTIGIALLIFAAQIVFSVVWLKFFRYGPMEWLWRSLTYRTRQPMLRHSELLSE